MFGPPGFAYVYFTYGMHWCLNVVAGVEGQASAVLLRAGAVVAGIEVARARRPTARLDRDLARGPARLTQALGIDAAANGTFLLDGSGPITLRLPESPVDTALIRSGPRVGVAGGHDTPWRFWLDGEPTVSAYRRHTPRLA
jgi:DNA-3-methyladenine glycosylase